MKIKVDNIVNRDGTGSPILGYGATISSGQTLSGSGVNVVGIVTASSFLGDGTNLTGLAALATAGRVYAYKRILGYDEFRS